jgi:hypothetical protein
MLVLSIEILPKMFCIYLYQHFIKQYKNTGSYYRKLFSSMSLDSQDMHYNYIM